MRPVREQKVPKLQHLRQRRRAGAHGQHRRESVHLRLHALADQVGRQFRVQDGKALVHEFETVVHAVHGAADVARALARDEAVEGDEGFGFGTGGVEEGRAEDVHALHVDAWGGAAGFGALRICRGGGVVRMLDDRGSVLKLGTSELVGGIGWGSAIGD